MMHIGEREKKIKDSTVFFSKKKISHALHSTHTVQGENMMTNHIVTISFVHSEPSTPQAHPTNDRLISISSTIRDGKEEKNKTTMKRAKNLPSFKPPSSYPPNMNTDPHSQHPPQTPLLIQQRASD